MPATTPDSIREVTDHVLASKDYHLDIEENALAPFWERMREVLFSVLGYIGELFSFLDGLPQVVRWLIIAALFVLLVLLVGHILYSIFSALRPGKNKRLRAFEVHQRRDSPALWEDDAIRNAESGNYIEASRLLLKASLFRLEDSFDRPFRHATTNREYLRKYRRLSVLDDVRQLVETIDRKWYGEETCDRSDYEACRQSHAVIRESIQHKNDVRQESSR